jgi:hypothetical protein
MKMMRLFIALLLPITFLAQPAHASSCVSNCWTLKYPNFSQSLQGSSWDWVLTPTSGAVLSNGDLVSIDISSPDSDFSASGYQYVTQDSQDSIKLSTSYFKDYLKKLVGKANLVAKVSISRSYSSPYSDVDLTWSMIPLTGFPTRPIGFTGFVTLPSDFSSKVKVFPKSCDNYAFSYNLNDPFGDVDNIEFDLIGTDGKKIDYTSDYGLENGLRNLKFYICPTDLDSANLDYLVSITISFVNGSGLSPISSSSVWHFEDPNAETKQKISSMGVVCSKKTSYQVSGSGKCSAGYKSVSFQTLDSIGWNKLNRMAGTLAGKNILVYGCVAQFDSNTGGSQFRAYASNSNPSNAYSGVNSLFYGSASKLLSLAEGDKFYAKVTIQGSTSYSTTLGGQNSVPKLTIRDFIKLGTC